MLGNTSDYTIQYLLPYSKPNVLKELSLGFAATGSIIGTPDELIAHVLSCLPYSSDINDFDSLGYIEVDDLDFNTTMTLTNLYYLVEDGLQDTFHNLNEIVDQISVADSLDVTILTDFAYRLTLRYSPDNPYMSTIKGYFK